LMVLAQVLIVKAAFRFAPHRHGLFRQFDRDTKGRSSDERTWLIKAIVDLEFALLAVVY
jgi:hypothetical protein